jgi:hypothetical protein
MLGLAAVLLGPATSLLTPWGIVEAGASDGNYLTSIWVLSTLLGAVVGLLLLDRAGGLWGELGPAPQVLAAATVIGLGALLHGGAALLGLRALGQDSAIPWIAALLCVGHWSALGAFAQRLPGSLTVRLLTLVALGWWLPALGGASAAWQRLEWLLAPARHLAVAGSHVATPWAILADTIPLVAWWVASLLLPTRSAFRR